MKKKSMIPEKSRVVGGSGEGNRKIYISREVYKEIFGFSKDKNVRQCGGILLGEIVDQNGIKYTIIRAFIEAKHSEGTSNSITFTKDTWNYIDQEKENYPEYDIVGWMHTNPDTGRRATEYDVFFQTHMFENKDIVAYIVDPVQIAEAFYFLDGEQFVRTNGFYVFTEAVMPKVLPKKKTKASAREDLEELELVEVPDVANQVVPNTMEMADEVGASLAADMAQAMEEVEEIARATANNLPEGDVAKKSTTDISKAVVDSKAVAYQSVDMAPPLKQETKATDTSTINSLENTSEMHLRQVFEEAEKKVEEDNSDVEAFAAKSNDKITDKVDISNVAVADKGNTKIIVLVSILTILVVGMAVTVGVSFKRIYQLEKEIDRLYNNDRIIAKYINTGNVEGNLTTPTEASTNAVEETTVAAEDKAETTAATEETQAEGETPAEGETQAEVAEGETQAEGAVE